MAIGKRTTLRAKIAAKKNKSTTRTNTITPNTLKQEDNPFLNKTKLTKRQKSHDKSIDFINKLNKTNQSDHLSKSTIRRLKKKKQEKLSTNIQELLNVLEEKPKPKLNHLPNPQRSLRGARKVELMEKQRFGLILKDKSYQNSPFELLRKTFMERNI